MAIGVTNMKRNNNEVKSLKRKYASTKIAISIFRYFFLISVSYVVIFQLAYMISYAFRPSSEMTDPSVVWVPKAFTMANFKESLELLDYGKAFFNTIMIQILSGVAEILTCAVAAYGFARFRFCGQKLMFALVLLTILVPPQMTAIPMSLNYSHFDILGILELAGKIVGRDIRPNLLDSGFVFWLPSFFGTGLRSGLFIFIYRQFFKTLPHELEEAAYIDGAGALKTFFGVILPSSGVAMLTVAIFSVVWHWNDYYLSVLFLNDKFPLSVKLKLLGSSAVGLGISVDRGTVMSACLLFIMPVIIMYVILQRKFIQSIDRVGIVG